MLTPPQYASNVAKITHSVSLLNMHLITAEFFLVREATMAGMLMQLPCQQKRMASVLAGAMIVYTNNERILGLPRVAAWAMAGMAVDVMCRGGDIQFGSQEMLNSAAMGVVGATVVNVASGMGVL